MRVRYPDPDPDRPEIANIKRLFNPANWGVDRYGRPTIALEHHRVTLHRFGSGWTWSCERYDEPGFIRRGVKVYPLIAARVDVRSQLWTDLVDGGMEREMVYRRAAASAPKKRRPLASASSLRSGTWRP